MAEKETTKRALLIAQIADTHLRDSQYATARRGVDFYRALEETVDAACARADILVAVGDIFDRSRPSPNVIGQLMAIDTRLRKAGKTMLSVTGNHDWCNPTWLATLFPGRDADTSGIVPIDGETVTVAGYTFAGILPHNAGAFRSHMAEIEVQARDADVVLYHGLVDGVVPIYTGHSKPLHCDEFPISMNNKAWLLGDIHIRGHVTRKRPGGGDCVISYPGSTEMCSSSEPKDKGFPIWKLTADAMELVEVVSTPIRPFFSGDIETEEQLDELVSGCELVADQHPVVCVKFSRSLPQTINRLHSVLDAQRSVIRCHPLPDEKSVARRERDDGAGELGMEHFVSKRFEGEPEMQSVALALLHRGNPDAENIAMDMIEARLASTGVREDD